MADGQTLKTNFVGERTHSLAAAQEHMRHHRWTEAADSLLRLEAREVPEEFQLNVCRNLAAMQRCRPAIYQAIMGAHEPERYTVGLAACGRVTIFYRTDDGSQVSLSPGNEPVAGLSSVFASIKQQYQSNRPMAVVGIGDGYFLKSCALNPPKSQFGVEQSIYLLEPDAQAVLACMTIHDYSGPTGPIESERFRWFVGSNHAAAARECLLGDLYNPAPAVEVLQSPHQTAVSADLRRMLDELLAQYEAMRSAVNAYYATVTREQLAAIFSAAPPRQPRVLLITTRSSSVLQFSTRDTAEAFCSIGWDVRIFIEPTLHHAVTGPKLMELLHDFKPDSVFQIDHLRSEWTDTYPPQLPFICWVQDHLPNLTNAAAGAKITPRDFLLCGMPRMYSDRFGYPARQFLQMPKLTRIPDRVSPPPRAGDDLVYVSSASQTPQQRARQIVEEEGASEPLRNLLTVCCRQMIDVYASGQTISTPGSILPIVKRAERETGVAIADDAARQVAVDKLFDRLNNVLYRQQALRWAQAVADAHGLSLSIYGPGWNAHPEFARHARGPIAYGAPLEELTRSSRINLVLEPTLNISHQRLLDALSAGGFCLIRHHPANVSFQNLLNFLCRHVPESARTVAHVRRALAPELEPEFESLIRGFAEGYAMVGDPVTHTRGLFDSQILLNRPWALPHLAEVSFNNEIELEARVLSYLSNPERYRKLAAEQRTDIEGRFSYAHGMRRMVTWIGQLLAEEN